MSASEKLKARLLDSDLSSDERTQIVAVVEAAQRMSDNHPPKHDPPCGFGSCELATALTALEEALGGDVT